MDSCAIENTTWRACWIPQWKLTARRTDGFSSRACSHENLCNIFTSMNINRTTNEHSRIIVQKDDRWHAFRHTWKNVHAAEKVGVWESEEPWHSQIFESMPEFSVTSSVSQKQCWCPALQPYREYRDISLNFHQGQDAARSFRPQGRPSRHTERYSSQHLMCMVCGTLLSHSCVCVGFSALFLIHSLCVESPARTTYWLFFFARLF